MNQRTVSHSATVRSSEISDVSLLHAALYSTQSTSHFNLFFFLSAKVEHLIVGYGVV